MKLTKGQQRLCDKYGARDEDGFVHCKECPLAIDHTYHLCMANASISDLKDYGIDWVVNKEEDED